MILEYTCPVTKIISGKIEIPDNQLDNKNEEEKLKIYKIAIAKFLLPLHNQGFFVLEDDIQFNNAEYV